MNNLSWLIYFADVSGSIHFFMATVFVICCLCLAGGIISVPVTDGDVLEGDNWKKFMTRAVIIGSAAFLIGAIVPGRNTIYAIAASEMGEEVLNSETGSLATQALNTWLQRQITPPAETE